MALLSPSTILLIPIFAFLWLSTIIIYRLTWHPLSSYPGPWLSRVCGVQTFYHAWKGDLHYHLYALHYVYGKHLRYSPNKLSINDANALNEIYGFNKNVGKPESFYRAFRVNAHAINTFNTSSKEAHRRKRRIMAKGFSDAALTSYERSIEGVVSEMMGKLAGGDEPTTGSSSERGGGEAGKDGNGGGIRGVFNWAHEANCLTLDIMGRLCFGAAFGFIGGKGDELMRSFHKRAVRVYMTSHEPLFKSLYLDRIFFPQMAKASTALADYARAYTLKRVQKYRSAENKLKLDLDLPNNANLEDKQKAKYGMMDENENGNRDGKEDPDILSHLLDARDEETNSVYTENELLGEAILLMMAGSDTTATALTATLFYLAHHPSAQLKLRAELTREFPSSTSPLTFPTTTSTPYLRACISESMRLTPPSPTNIPRVVLPGGITILNTHFPAGVYVGVPNFALFRSEEWFRDGNSWVPERWLSGSEERAVGGVDGDEDGKDEDKESDLKKALLAFKPFSLGPRHCIASRLAVKEIAYVVARIVQGFDFELRGGTERDGACGIKSGRLPHGILPGVGDEVVVMRQMDVFTSLEGGPVFEFRVRE